MGGYLKQGSFMVLSGKVVGDAKYREFESGTRVASIKVCYGTEQVTKSGENGEEESTKGKYLTVKAWGEKADYGRWVERGDVLLAVGNLLPNNYTDRHGNPREEWYLNADFLEVQPKVEFTDDGMMTPGTEGDAWDYPEALR